MKLMLLPFTQYEVKVKQAPAVLAVGSSDSFGYFTIIFPVSLFNLHHT